MRRELVLPRAKKSLGQSFLTDNNIINKIVSSCALDKNDTVLEIGPGHGELTSALLERVKQVVAVEIDPVLYNIVERDFAGHEGLKLINADILKVDLAHHLKGANTRIKVIANIPYYITTPILEYLFGYAASIDEIYLTVQKEFARRVVSSPGNKEYGSFSCFAQYYTESRILFYIKKGSFSPSPKVDSAFIAMKVRREAPVRVKDRELLFGLIRSAFGQRRKMLKNTLKDIVPQALLDQYFRKYSIDPKVRAEELSLQDFADLANLK